MILFSFALVQCGDANHSSKNSSDVQTIMEVTTFNVNKDVDQIAFAQRDGQVQADFTSKQPGFIKRQSGLNDKGEYAVVVFWETMANAEASMSKFMKDKSVADYAAMIDGPTMKMNRYEMTEKFNADKSEFVEVMSFDLNEGTDLEKFNMLNKKVETDYTGTRKGFLQRMMGSNDEGRQAVAVYWTNKEDSDASLDGFMKNETAKKFMSKMNRKSMQFGRYKFLTMDLTNKEKAVAVLNSFNTGSDAPLSFVNPDKYIQHNLGAPDGFQAFAGMVKMASKQGFKAKVIRAFEDGDYVFTHTEYDFFGPKVGFDIFRFENGLIVEHWDNMLEVAPANPSGHTQTDGSVDITDKAKTAQNKKLVETFITDLMLEHKDTPITNFISPETYIQHNPMVGDGLEGFGAAMAEFGKQGLVMEYDKLHMVLGEGNFVLTASEGTFGKGQPTAYYDLFRIDNGLIVEHWDVIAPIPPKSEWKNENGKF